MTSPSNLYAEKIFADQPTLLWALDDKADYISLISELERDINATWSFVNGSVAIASIIKEPFIDSATNLAVGDFPTTFPNDMLMVSPYLFNFNELNSNPGNVNIGTYFYSDSAFLESITIGYLYIDPTTSLLVQDSKTFNSIPYQKWSFISAILPALNISTDVAIFINLKFKTGGASSSDYHVYLNGISVGQYAENFAAESLGVEKITVPSSIALAHPKYGIEAFSYGSAEDNGYYLADKSVLSARNTGIPLVFGASNVTKISPNGPNDTKVDPEDDWGRPSLIVPGKGFLNEIGKYKEYTAEFWARIDCRANQPRKIFGSIASNDGLWVEKEYLVLKIGEYYGKYFVGEWFRPMLVQIRYSNNTASLLINSEEVISLSIDKSKISFPSELSLSGKNQDWLGFYAYPDVDSFEIDCVAIYPYIVSQTVAKRKMVYAQAVSSSEKINSSYGGESTFIDYPFADYTANYIYPDFASFEQGTSINLQTDSSKITHQKFQIPNVFLQDKTINDLYNDSNTLTPYRHTYYNFMRNPTFNNGTTGWFSTTGFTTFSVTNDGIGSTNCLRITNNFTTSSGTKILYHLNGGTGVGSYKGPITGGLPILSFKVRAFNKPVRLRLWHSIFNASLGYLGEWNMDLQNVYTPEEGWQTEIAIPYSTSTTSYIGYIGFELLDPVTGLPNTADINGTQWAIDDLMLYHTRDRFYRQPYLPYFDGSKEEFSSLLPAENYAPVISWGITGSGTVDNESRATVNYNSLDRYGYKPISFRPNSTWNDKQCYFEYNKFSFLTDPIDVIMVNFIPSSDITTKQTIFKVYNTRDESYFICFILNGLVYLLFSQADGTDLTMFTYTTLAFSETFGGIKISEAIKYSFNNEFSSRSSIRSFFANPGLLKMYLGGDEDGNTFLGTIYGISIVASSQSQKMVNSNNTEQNPFGIASDGWFNYYGAPQWDQTIPIDGKSPIVALIDRKKNSYVMKPMIDGITNKVLLKTKTYGEWTDYVPMTYFAQYVSDRFGNNIYDLDFIQFNISCPDLQSFNKVKSYLTFQYIETGPNKTLDEFSIEVDLGTNRVLDLNDYPNWLSTKFRVYDNTLIYPRKDVSFEDLAIVYTLAFDIEDTLENQVEIKTLEFASQALSDNTFNKIGTRYGSDLYPYKKVGFYYDNKGKNPFLIYKGTTPYLYLSKKSGIQPYLNFNEASDMGLSIPINKNLANDYQVGGIQSWFYYGGDAFPSNEFVLFKIEHKTGEILVCASSVNSSNTRAKIYLKDSETGNIISGVGYHWNGVLVKEPVFSVKEWGSLGLSFLPSLVFDLSVGYIKLVSPLVFNNISFYRPGYLEQIQSTRMRMWIEVKEEGLTSFEWNYWFNSFVWDDVLIIGYDDSFAVDPSIIYKNYIGTNKIIIDDNEGIIVDGDRFGLKKDVKWSTIVQSPV